MNKIDYLNNALNAGRYKELSWLYTIFTIVESTKPDEHTTDPIYTLYQTATGYYYLSEEHTIEKISDAKAGEIFIRPTDDFTALPTVHENIKSPIETKFGNVLLNKCIVTHCFGNKVKFFTGMYKPDAIEKAIVDKIVDDPDTPSTNWREYPETDDIYVSQYKDFLKACTLYERLADILNISATIKNIQPPPGITEYKKKLIEEAGGLDNIKDPIVVKDIENKLMAYMEEWLKDDPSANVFSKDKKVQKAMKKMFLLDGWETGFDTKGEEVFIPNSLAEGWGDDAKEFTGRMNSLRSGSYSRAMETAEGGVMAKILIRGTNNYIVDDMDCGTTEGIPRHIEDYNIHTMVGRSIRKGNNWVLIKTKEEATAYLGKDVIIRSPMYCKHKDPLKLCVECMGTNYHNKPNGIPNAIAALGHLALSASMAKMHVTGFDLVDINVEDNLS